MIELVLERDAVVDRLEQTAGSGGDPVGAGIGLKDGNGGDAPAHVGRADRAPGQRFHPVGGNRSLGESCRGRRRRRGRLAKFVELAGERLDLLFQVGQLLLAILVLSVRRQRPGSDNHAGGQASDDRQATCGKENVQHREPPSLQNKEANPWV